MASGTIKVSPKFGTKQSITFPWTATADGMMEVVAIPSGSSDVALYIGYSGNSYALTLRATAGGNAGGCLPIQKGVKYEIVYSSGMQTCLAYFLPFV